VKSVLLLVWTLFLLYVMGLSIFLLSADRLYVEKYMGIKTNNTVSLFVKPTTKILPKYNLGKGDYAKYQYLSKSGQWIYVLYKGEVLTAKTDQLRVKYIKYKSNFISTLSIYLSIIVSLLFFVITLFKVKISSSSSKKMSILNGQYLQDIKKLSILNDQHLLGITRLDKRLIERQKVLNTIVDDCDFFKNKCSLVESENKKLQKRIKAFKEELDSAEIVKQQVIKKLKQELDEFYKEESLTIVHPSITDMKTSEARLVTQLDKQVQEGLIFGVDFKHDRYENILKGRKFEIFIATWLTKELGFEIEEWSPDKGFEQDILVKSNLNPDLIVSNSTGEKFGIECKYRSKYFKQNETEFSWGTTYQGKRYERFQGEKNYPVYVCLGVFGTADNPESFSMLSIKKLIDKSFKKKFSKASSEQFVVSKANIEALDESSNSLFSALEPIN